MSEENKSRKEFARNWGLPDTASWSEINTASANAAIIKNKN